MRADLGDFGTLGRSLRSLTERGHPRRPPAGQLAALALILAALAACGDDDERGTGDAPARRGDDSPAEVLNFPDGFSNVAHKCDGHGHRVYVTTQNANGKQMAVVADPACGDSELGDS